MVSSVSRRRLPPADRKRYRHGIRQHHHRRGQRDPRPRTAVHPGRHGRRELRRRLEQEEGRRRGRGLVLQRELLPPARRERRGVDHQGLPRRGLRHAPAAQLGHPRRRSPFEPSRSSPTMSPRASSGHRPRSARTSTAATAAADRAVADKAVAVAGRAARPRTRPRPHTTWTRSRSSPPAERAHNEDEERKNRKWPRSRSAAVRRA